MAFELVESAGFHQPDEHSDQAISPGRSRRLGRAGLTSALAWVRSLSVEEPGSPDRTDDAAAAEPAPGWRRGLAALQSRWEHGTNRARALIPALDLAWALGRRYRRLNGSVLIGHLTYRFFLWLAPFLLVTVGLLGFTAWADVDIVAIAEQAGLSEAYVTSVGTQTDRSWPYVLAVGGFGLVYATYRLMQAVHYVFAQIWEVEIRPPRGAARVVALLLGAAFVTTLLMALVGWLRNAGPLLRLSGGTASLVLSIAAFLIVNRILPRRTDSPAELLPGAVAAGSGLFLLQLVAQLWLPRRIASSSQLYGSLGLAFGLLIYLWVIATLLVASAYINSVWLDRRRILAGRPLVTDPEQLPEWMRPTARRLTRDHRPPQDAPPVTPD